MEQNKIRTYLLYAIGEILLVVIGILIALQINNWNEERKLEADRILLLSEMKSDFETTRLRLNNSTINSNGRISRQEKFLSLAYKKSTGVPIDSIQYYLGAAFELTQIQPLLTSYNQAVSTGKISLVKNPFLSEKIAEFLLSYKFYNEHIILSGNMFYNTSIWELRKEIGTLHSLEGDEADLNVNRVVYPDAYPMSDKEFRTYISQPHVFAAFENFLTLHYNIRDMFLAMDKTAEEIIEQLNVLLAEAK